MEIDEHLEYTFLQFDPAPNTDKEKGPWPRKTPDYFL
jgi:hypothetical protein